MKNSQKGSWAPIGHNKTSFWAPRAGPRLPFGDALAPKAAPELPQEGTGAKFNVIFINLGQVFVNLGGERELQQRAMNDGL